MSLLWPRILPDTVFVGLFAEHCWLQGRRTALAHSLIPEVDADASVLLPALESMLDANKKQLRKGTRLVLTVSDSLAAFTMLPWQDALQRPEELESYAQVFFERQGVKLDADWIMRTEFIRFGANGVAYAFRRSWIQQLEEVIRARNLQLYSVLPISAAAYCRQPRLGKNGKSLVLLREKHRVTSLYFNPEGLQSCDIEPVVASEAHSGTRLLRRQVSTQQNVGVAGVWSPLPVEQRGKSDFIEASLPGIRLENLPHGSWR